MRLKKFLAGSLAALLLTASAVPVITALEPHGTGIKMRNWMINDPDYEFSDAYKTSVWYQNFTSLDFSENERNTVLRIAISQLGYHEGDSASDFDGMNMAGSSNYIEYARLLVTNKGENYNDNHYEWCACFVNWCLSQAHIDYASSEIGCWKWVGELKAMGMWQDSAAYRGTYEPQPADMIFFNWDGKNTGSGHIGYVLYTTDTHVYTIEGNADNNVTIRSYELNDPCVIGYGTPPYDEGKEETIDFSYAEGRPRGYYVVNSMTSNLTSEPDGGSRITKVPLGSCVELCEIEEDYAKVIYDGNEGYLPQSVLVLMTPLKGVDTVTFDANGGENAPAAQEITIGESGTLTSDVPTLVGDTFLGWALRPYDMVPVYKPGDTVKTEGDMTLYAIWEKHSRTLAEEALNSGSFASLPRPTATENASAVIPGSINPALLIPKNGTNVTVTDDATYGKVLSLSSTGACSDPYVTLPYAAVMKSVQLAPKNASDIKYVVLCVKNTSLSNRSFDLFYTCANSGAAGGNDQTAQVVSKVLAKDEDWQYVVFDMQSAKGWSGELQSLRLDYERASLAEGETLLLSGLYLLSSDAELAALTEEDLYFFLTEEKLPAGEETTTEDIPVVAPGGDTTDGEGATQAPDTDDETATTDKNSSCNNIIGISTLTLTIPAAMMLIKRRKDGED